MNFQVLVIQNKGVKDSARDHFIRNLKEKVDSKTPLKVFVDVKKMDLQNLENVPFTTGDLWGLKGIKERIRPWVNPLTFHAVIFMYRPDDDWDDLAAWTYPNPLHYQNVFIEVPVRDSWQDWIEVIGMHEIMHAFNRRVWFSKRLQLQDTMDNYTGLLQGVDENLERLNPFWKDIAKRPTFISILLLQIQALFVQVGILKKQIGAIVPQRGFEEFAQHMRVRESSGNYGVVNHQGFLGAYQFGLPRLSDLGLTQKTDNGFEWVAPYSKEVFLSNKELQDETFKKHVQWLRNALLSSYKDFIGTEVQGVKITLSGMVAGAHLGGIGGVARFLNGENPRDSLGTTVGDYIREFSDYEL